MPRAVSGCGPDVHHAYFRLLSCFLFVCLFSLNVVPLIIVTSATKGVQRLCVHPCLSVSRISQKVVVGFWPNLVDRLSVRWGRIDKILVKIRIRMLYLFFKVIRRHWKILRQEGWEREGQNSGEQRYYEICGRERGGAQNTWYTVLSLLFLIPMSMFFCCWSFSFFGYSCSICLFICILTPLPHPHQRFV